MELGGVRLENAVWSYQEPFDESSLIKDYMAFGGAAVDDLLLDETPIPVAPREILKAADNALVDWLIQEAWQAQTTKDLVARLAAVLRRDGVPLWRLRLMIRTLNPQLFALAYTWQSGQEEIAEYEASHAGRAERAIPQ